MSYVASIIPTGSTQATAAPLQVARNYVYSGDPTGNYAVILPVISTMEGWELPVFNRTGFTITIFPPVGGQIETNTVNAGVQLLSGSVGRFSISPTGTIVLA